MSETRSWISRLLCFIGCHKWDQPGGECEECGFPDTLFDDFDTEGDRIEKWRKGDRA